MRPSDASYSLYWSNFSIAPIESSLLDIWGLSRLSKMVDIAGKGHGHARRWVTAYLAEHGVFQTNPGV